MKFSEIELPSNKNFGFFFTFVFVVAAGYFFYREAVTAAYICAALAIAFFLATLIKADVLLPLNKLWMRFGLLIGMIVSPIVLGLIFFVMFTPIAFAMRLFGRDELRLRIRNENSHWIGREMPIQSDSFKNQF